MDIGCAFEQNGIIEEIIDRIHDALDEENEGIVLYGSAASNDMNYIVKESGIVFLSDIELIVIPYCKQNVNAKAFKEKIVGKVINEVNKISGIIKPPHIDILPVSKDYFSELKPRISTYELKHNARELKGTGYLSLIQDVTPENYNQKIQNIEIIKALKMLTLESNRYFFHSDEDTRDSLRYNYYISGLYLSVLRTLLPQFGIFEASPAERIKRLSEIKDKPELEAIDAKSVYLNMEELYQNRKNGVFSYTDKELFNMTLSLYISFLAYLLECDEATLLIAIQGKISKALAGSEEKKEILTNLLVFFIRALDCIKRMINDGTAYHNEINKLEESFDRLLAGDYSYRLVNILDMYDDFENERWRIINSKD